MPADRSLNASPAHPPWCQHHVNTAPGDGVLHRRHIGTTTATTRLDVAVARYDLPDDDGQPDAEAVDHVWLNAGEGIALTPAAAYTYAAHIVAAANLIVTPDRRQTLVTP